MYLNTYYDLIITQEWPIGGKVTADDSEGELNNQSHANVSEACYSLFQYTNKVQAKAFGAMIGLINWIRSSHTYDTDTDTIELLG